MSSGDWSAEWQQRENENALRENRAPAVLIPLYQPPTEQVITTARYRELLAAETDLAFIRDLCEEVTNWNYDNRPDEPRIEIRSLVESAVKRNLEGDEELSAAIRVITADLAQARTELAAYKEKTCDTCKHCDETFPEHCLQWDHWNCDSDFYCAAHERRAQSAEDEKGEKA